jgi:hypothetical protein
MKPSYPTPAEQRRQQQNYLMIQQHPQLQNQHVHQPPLIHQPLARLGFGLNNIFLPTLPNVSGSTMPYVHSLPTQNNPPPMQDPLIYSPGAGMPSNSSFLPAATQQNSLPNNSLFEPQMQNSLMYSPGAGMPNHFQKAPD